MEVRKWAVVTGILLIGIISGNLAQSSGNGRKSRVLEDTLLPQFSSSYSYDATNPLEASSDRSMSAERNMMLYRTVFTISLKLLTAFLLVRLFAHVAGGGRQQGVPIVPFQPGAGGQGYYQQPGQAVNVNYNPATTLITATSTGAAAGASTGGAAGVVAGAGTIPAGGYIATAATNPRPSFLLPRFRFGGLRLPPPFRPHMMRHPVSHHNMGTETHVVETHSHLYVHPDGTQTRVPMAAPVAPNAAKPSVAASSNSPVQSTPSEQTAQATDTQAKTSSADVAAESSPVETVVTSSSSSSSTTQQAAERRSSLAYKERLSHLQQAYEDWNLHFNPGTRSL